MSFSQLTWQWQLNQKKMKDKILRSKSVSLLEKVYLKIEKNEESISIKENFKFN